jgi:SagB-type dehydrogenase family enzyme
VNPALEWSRALRDCSGEQIVHLPPATLETGDLAAALRARRTARRFGGGPLTIDDLATLLSLGAGCTIDGMSAALLSPQGPPAGRTYPSGGALYPIELVVCPLKVELVPPGFYLYQPLSHQLVSVASIPAADEVVSWFPNHPIADAGLLLLLSMDFSRPSLGKYGERAYRLALLEAGHLAQNVLLLAVALGLAGLPMCGYDDRQLSVAAGLAFPDAAVVYALAVGSPPADPSTDLP